MTARGSRTLPLIPRPVEARVLDGDLALTALDALTVSSPDAIEVADLFRDTLAGIAGIRLPEPSVALERATGAVHIELRDGGAPEALSPEAPSASGAHTVTIDGAGIVVTSDSVEGIHRGLTTVVQACGTAAEALPHVQIRDTARFGWRGLSLDTARSFVPVDEVERVIDVLSLYKLNVLHLHLSDNEGWRLQIESRPGLTPAAADGSRSHYTAAELKRLSAYASRRFVTLVPELDLPGHVGAALRAYPELNRAAALDGPFPMANLDPASPDAWAFVDEVLTALAAATDGPYIHIGGDEAFGMDDAAHVAFVDRALARVAELGKRVVGWQEVSRAGVGPEHIVQHWIDFSAAVAADADEPSGDREHGEAATGIPPAILAMLKDNFIKAAQDIPRIAEQGPRVIMSPTSSAYLDRPHGDRTLDEEQHERLRDLGLAYYPPTPLRAYLEWDPAAVSPMIPEDRIIGVEAALWTESASTPEHRGALLLPRLPAIAEVAWSRSTSEWSEHRERLAAHAPLWDSIGVPWYRAGSVDWPDARPLPAAAR